MNPHDIRLELLVDLQESVVLTVLENRPADLQATARLLVAIISSMEHAFQDADNSL